MLKRVARKLLSVAESRIAVARVGRGPVGLIDVGSIGGLPAPWRRNAGQIGFLLNFEPNDKANRQQRILTLDTALWSESTERKLYVYSGYQATGSSLFEQNFEYVDANWDVLKHIGPPELATTWHERSRLVQAVSVQCRALDEVLVENVLSKRLHFLKIDAQGAEFEILDGARKFLSEQCVGLHLELFSLPLYKEIRLKPDVIDLLARFGFDLVKEFPPHGSFNSQNDCIFLHRERGPENVRRVIASLYDR